MTSRRVQREIKHMSRLKGKHGVKVGLPKGSGEYPSGVSVVAVGFWNEFGTKFAPERSWMRSSIRDHLKSYRSINRKSLLAIQQKTMTAARAMARLGQQARDDMIAQIESFTIPGLADSTIAARKRRSGGKESSRPLEDTGQMKGSVTFEVMT